VPPAPVRVPPRPGAYSRVSREVHETDSAQVRRLQDEIAELRKRFERTESERPPRSTLPEVRSVVAPVPSSRVNLKGWAGALALITALGGYTGIKALLDALGASASDVAALTQRLDQAEQRERELRTYLQSMHAAASGERAVVGSALCQLGATAPGLDCDAVGWLPEPLGDPHAVRQTPRWQANERVPAMPAPP
jgi:hypothetical protein